MPIGSNFVPTADNDCLQGEENDGCIGLVPPFHLLHFPNVVVFLFRGDGKPTWSFEMTIWTNPNDTVYFTQDFQRCVCGITRKPICECYSPNGVKCSRCVKRGSTGYVSELCGNCGHCWSCHSIDTKIYGQIMLANERAQKRIRDAERKRLGDARLKLFGPKK